MTPLVVAVRIVSPAAVGFEYACLACAKLKLLNPQAYQLLIDGGPLEGFILVDLHDTSIDPIDGDPLAGCFCGGGCDRRLFSFS